MKAETIARWEHKHRAFLMHRLSPKHATWVYSKGRQWFLKKLAAEYPEEIHPSQGLERKLWGISFRSPLGNAAGMWKNGEAYNVMVAQGAGAYLAGTTTANPRKGNKGLPFLPYPLSGAASNWLGLPNEGDMSVGERLKAYQKVDGCPIGVSVMRSPDLKGQEQLDRLVRGMYGYMICGVDFIEVNESCPNTRETAGTKDEVRERLEYLRDHFLCVRDRRLPVIVKFASNTQEEQLPVILDMVLRCGFDGVNFGNTVTNYNDIRPMIHHAERGLFEYFVNHIGGGVSGRPLKEMSLRTAAAAVAYVRACGPDREFHVWRTGGIETGNDIIESEKAGISMNWWFTGYFNRFAEVGHRVYQTVYDEFAGRVKNSRLKAVDERKSRESR